MKDKQTIEGQWQIFPNSRRAIVGSLKFEPEEGLELTVKTPNRHGLMGVYDFIKVGSQQCPTTIRGIDADRQAVTIFGCGIVETNRAAGLESYRIHAMSAVLGAHFQSWPDISCKVVTVQYSLLDNWLMRFVAAHKPAPEDSELIQLQKHPEIVAKLEDQTVVTIRQRRWQNPGIETWSLSQKHEVEFRFESSVKLRDALRKFIHPFRNLLTFLTGKKVYIDSIRFKSERQSEDSSPLIYLAACNGISKANRKAISHFMLVPYAEVAARLPTLINEWFAYYQRMEAIISLYFTSIWSSGIPNTTQFLLLAQALEAYHSRSTNFASCVQTSREFRTRVAAILGEIESQSERSWLREKLQHANRKNLAQKLHELISSQNDVAASFLKDADGFANKIRHTRNYYTHFDEQLRRSGKVAEGGDLATLTFQMRALLQVCILRDLQLPQKAVNRIVEETRKATIISLDN